MLNLSFFLSLSLTVTTATLAQSGDILIGRSVEKIECWVLNHDNDNKSSANGYERFWIAKKTCHTCPLCITNRTDSVRKRTSHPPETP